MTNLWDVTCHSFHLTYVLSYWISNLFYKHCTIICRYFQVGKFAYLLSLPMLYFIWSYRYILFSYLCSSVVHEIKNCIELIYLCILLSSQKDKNQRLKKHKKEKKLFLVVSQVSLTQGERTIENLDLTVAACNFIILCWKVVGNIKKYKNNEHKKCKFLRKLILKKKKFIFQIKKHKMKHSNQ